MGAFLFAPAGRIALTIGAGVMMEQWLPAAIWRVFWMSLCAVYLSTLALETVLLVRSLSSPAGGNAVTKEGAH
jgi:hypothetical protein